MNRARSKLARAFAQVLAGLAVLAVWGSVKAQTAESPVQVELIIPSADTHVIGDHTPLIWRFRNNATEPLAFMWEGCCRLNGRLTVTAEERPITPVPPGQALAHMFAKAERLEPGHPADFDTRLSDWVQLHESGEYRLQGRYTGVLPEQRPQVPSGLSLWRAAAVTPPIKVSLLSVADYLGERPRRVAARGLQLDLTGPARLAPLRPSPLQLALVNTSGREQRLTWPGDLQLWIVDAKGRRLGNVATSIEGDHEELILPPGARVEKAVPFDSSRLEGEPFGVYQLFTDLTAAGPDRPRVPSNPINLQWDLGLDEVAQLLREAASGSRLGFRNAPLKLLRVYLAEIGPLLDAIDVSGAPSSLRTLRDQLRLASCLKGFGPVPGRFEIPVKVRADGTAHLAGSAVEACFGHSSDSASANAVSLLEQLIVVRRHLGWELGLTVEPDAGVTMGRLQETLQPFLGFGLDLAGPPRVLLAEEGTTNAPVAVTFRDQPIPAAMLVRMQKQQGTIQCTVARKEPSAAWPAPQAGWFKPDEARTATFSAVPDAASWADWLEAPVQTLVLADPTLTWTEFLKAAQPLRSRRMSFDLCLDF